MNLPDFLSPLATAHKAPTRRVVSWGGVYGESPPQNRTQRRTRRNTEGLGTVDRLSFLCAIMLPPLSPFSENRAFLCQATVDPAKFVAVVSVEGNKTSTPVL